MLFCIFWQPLSPVEWVCACVLSWWQARQKLELYETPSACIKRGEEGVLGKSAVQSTRGGCALHDLISHFLSFITTGSLATLFIWRASWVARLYVGNVGWNIDKILRKKSYEEG